jgi:hypothetical protein
VAAGLLEAIEETPSRTLTLLLCLGGLVFLGVQVPWSSSNADVYDYAAYAAQSDWPSRSYHIGHGVVLWMIYHVVPVCLRSTIWPSGFVSAGAIALAMAATFALWRRLGLLKREAGAIAVATLLVPSIWYHGTIGEVYALQLCLCVLFALFFADERLFPAALFFFLALLVSPLSVFAAPLLLLPRGRPRLLKQAAIVGAAAAALYAPVATMIRSSLKVGFSDLGASASATGPLEQIGRLGLILVVNLAWCSPWLLLGARRLLALRAALALSATAIVQLAMAVSAKDFLVELGSFQLLLFWVCAVPIGLGLARARSLSSVAGTVAVSALLTSALWLVPNASTGRELEDLAHELHGRFQRPIEFVGPYNETWPTVLSYYGWDYRAATRHFHETEEVSARQLARLGEPEAVLLLRRGGLRERLAAVFPAWVAAKRPMPEELRGALGTKIAANDAVAAYYWHASDSDRRGTLQP